MNVPRVLVVDDNPTVRDVLRTILEKLGCSVETAEDGNAALQRVRHDPPDLVVLDLRLPGLDGLEVVRRMRKKHRLRDVRILALTGYSHAQTREHALAAGCDSFLPKPFDVKTLRGAVAELIRLPGPEAPPRPERGD